jgi:fluoride exporter
MFNFFLVFLGGGIGSIIRYSIALLLARSSAATTFPFATLIANTLACFVMGTVLGLLATGQISESRKLLLLTGFCGGFSTFSTFTAESIALAESGSWWVAAFNIVGNLLLCAVALLLGLRLGAMLE